jgi:HAD superfamily 5'-nucleotidase-like hydrolase
MLSQKVFTNRTLNMRKIKFIGLDMDHTLVRYNSRNFEALAHQTMLVKLVEQRHYPDAILKLPFNWDLAVRGLIIDRKKGNLLKVSRHGAIRASFHGTKQIDFPAQQKLYKSTYIDLGDQRNYWSIDTAFSISNATLFAQLVDLKDGALADALPDYETLAADLLHAVDQSHRDGTLKTEVARNLDRYIEKDEGVVRGIEKFLRHEKKFFILTNSDYAYTKLLLDYAINPFLPEGQTWLDLFEIVIANAQKPRFFFDNLRFLKIDPKDGTMTNFDDTLRHGLYQGGCADKFTKDLGIEGDDILYIGDHIYGDILRLKKDCNWRTALVVDELAAEIQSYKKAEPFSSEIRSLMDKKDPIERLVVELISRKIETGKEADEGKVHELQGQITDLDKRISVLIKKQQAMFNQNWGEVFRAGNEESYFAHQVDRFACVYMAKLADLLELSPRTYFRAARRPLAHEIALDLG